MLPTLLHVANFTQRTAMPVQLNHFIVHARDSQASARFLAGLLESVP